MQSGARTLMATKGHVSLELVLDTGLFDYDRAASSAGWIRELQGEYEIAQACRT